MSEAGGSYLPPIVTKLTGDNSGLLKAFAEAKAAQESFTKSTKKMGDETKASTRKGGQEVDDFTKLVVRRMREGESATAVLRRELKRTGDEVATLRKRMSREGANQGLYAEFKRASDELKSLRKLAQQLAPDLLQAGEEGGQGFLKGFIGIFSSIGDYLIPILVGLFILAAPGIAAAVGAAVVAGLGLGFIGIGAMLAAKLLPNVAKAFGQTGNQLKKAMTYALSGGFDDGLIKGLKVFNTYIPQFKKELRTIFDALGPILPKLADALGKGLSGLLTSLGTAITNMTNNGSLQAIIDSIPEIMQSVGDFLVKVSENGPAISRFIKEFSKGLSGFLSGAGDVIAWLEGAYLWLAKLHDKAVAGGWDTPWNAIATGVKAIGGFFAWLWGKIVEGAKAAGGFFAGIGKSVWEFLKGAGHAVAGWFTSTVEWFQKLPGRVVGFLASLPGRVSRFFSDMAHKAAYWVGYLIGATVRFFIELPGKIRTWVTAAWNWVTKKFHEGVTATVGEARALPGQVATFFSKLWMSVTAWVSRTWHSVTSWFSRTRRSMIEHVTAAVNAVISWFRGLPGRAVTEVGKFRTRVTKFFSDARKWLADAGRDVVRGVIDGITGAWDWAVEKVKSFGHDIAKGFKDALGIKSPSTVFAESGEYSALGYLKGWRKVWASVKREMTGGTMSIATPPPGGAPRPPGGYGGTPPAAPAMVHTVVRVGDRAILDAITPASQRRGARSGITGTGAPTVRIM